jgi:hypothetical protein
LVILSLIFVEAIERLAVAGGAGTTESTLVVRCDAPHPAAAIATASRLNAVCDFIFIKN